LNELAFALHRNCASLYTYTLALARFTPYTLPFTLSLSPR
jgi:hypothetical protein